MLVLTSMLRRLPHLTHEEFVAYHRGHHAPLFKSTPEAQKYLLRYTVEHPRSTKVPSLPDSSFDAIVRMEFATRADLVRMFTSRSYREVIRPDEKRFFDFATSEFSLSEPLTVVGEGAEDVPMTVATRPTEHRRSPKRRPVRPLRWNPPPTVPGNRQPMPRLTIHPTSGYSTEDVTVRPDGQVVTGYQDGRIVAVDPETEKETLIAETGGRPLGLEVHPDGGLVVCDCDRGLLYVAPDGAVQQWVDEFAGNRLLFCNNAAVAGDGTVYFTDSSRRWGIDEWLGDVFEHRPTGRLFRRSPAGEVELLADELAFANGVALPPDESFVVVAETAAYRLTRIDLAGPTPGRRTSFVEGLPGFPDNISTGTDGNIWVTLVAPRVPLLDALLPRHPRWRRLLWSLPERLLPQGEDPLDVRAYTPSGQLVHDFHAEHAAFGNVTGVRQHGTDVWMGSIRHSALARFRLPLTHDNAPEPTA